MKTAFLAAAALAAVALPQAAEARCIDNRTTEYIEAVLVSGPPDRLRHVAGQTVLPGKEVCFTHFGPTTLRLMHLGSVQEYTAAPFMLKVVVEPDDEYPYIKYTAK